MHLKVGKSFIRLTNTFWLNEPSFQFYPNPSSDTPENSRSLCRDCYVSVGYFMEKLCSLQRKPDLFIRCCGE